MAKCFDDFAATEITDHAPIMILDVGSGALPGSGDFRHKRGLSSHVIRLQEEYKKLFDYEKHGQDAPIGNICRIHSPLMTAASISCSNALDHTQDPTKPSWKWKGFADPVGLIQGFENKRYMKTGKDYIGGIFLFTQIWKRAVRPYWQSSQRRVR